jgi:sugar (pentulose or hexulose) kinase
MSHALVFDIGKTHARALVFDAGLRCVSRAQRASGVLLSAPYPHLDTTGLWRWMLQAIRDAAARFRIARINVATHGAAAALVDPGLGGDGLVLPVLDYEHEAPARESGYDALRPPFTLTLSPALPAGLNLGRQLWWLQQCFPEAFRRARTVLTYPQYWAWRLGAAPSAEWTSLGCHTDLWAPVVRDYSALVDAQGWRALFPPLADARTALWPVAPAVARETGLDPACQVHTGLHDSNAGFARHLHAAGGEPFVLVSTGTWVVCMARGGDIAALDPALDMLANVDVCGQPVPCARFMGGREYARICELAGSDPAQAVTPAQLQAVIDASAFALPEFTGGNGPFAGATGRIEGGTAEGAALATLYVALVIAEELALLAAPGEVLIDGPFAGDPVLGGLVSALSGRSVHLCGSSESTALGAALLCDWQRPAPPVQKTPCPPCELRGLESYHAAWRDRVAGMRAT